MNSVQIITLLVFTVFTAASVSGQETGQHSAADSSEASTPELMPGDTIPGMIYDLDSVHYVFIDTSWFVPGDPDYSLILAADNGDYYAAMYLIEEGADVNAETVEEVTPLMYACQNGYYGVASLLIDHGADVNAAPYNGMTALISVSKTGDYDIAALLLEHGAKVSQKDYNGLSALMYASAYNYPGIVDLCLDHGADISQRDWLGNDPLIMAVYFGSFEAADELLDRGADVNTSDLSGFTPLHIACQQGDYHMAWMLLDRGADVSRTNRGRFTPLALAVMNGHQDLVDLLLDNGAEINQAVNGSRNPIDLAKKDKDPEMRQLLQDRGAKPNRSPAVSEVHFGAELEFNNTDFMLGASGGIYDSKYGIDLSTGFLFRPAAIRVLDIDHDTYATQFWERRYLFYLQAGRRLYLVRKPISQLAFVPGIRIIHSWSRLRGSATSPLPVYGFSPGAALLWKGEYGGVTFSYRYKDFDSYDISPHRFQLTVEFMFSLGSNKYNKKDIPAF